MRKLTSIFIVLAASAASAQTTTVNLSVPIPTAVLGDIQQHYLGETIGSVGTLSDAMDATTANPTVSIFLPSTTDPIAARLVIPAIAGAAVVLDSEPMIVASATPAIAGTQTLTLLRGTIPNIPAMMPHAKGVAMQVLKYPTPWAMLFDEALRPWTIGVIQSLGAKSNTLSSGITGTIQQ